MALLEETNVGQDDSFRADYSGAGRERRESSRCSPTDAVGNGLAAQRLSAPS